MFNVSFFILKRLRIPDGGGPSERIDEVRFDLKMTKVLTTVWNIIVKRLRNFVPAEERF